jgi:hypothetical protein
MAFRYEVVPVPRLPAERYGEDAAAQLQFIRERIDRRSNEEILADPEALSRNWVPTKTSWPTPSTSAISTAGSTPI